jgi:threonine/homoserine/homoserine lactone efflux protein
MPLHTVPLGAGSRLRAVSVLSVSVVSGLGPVLSACLPPVPGPIILLVMPHVPSYGRCAATAVVIGVALGNLTA